MERVAPIFSCDEVGEFPRQALVDDKARRRARDASESPKPFGARLARSPHGRNSEFPDGQDGGPHVASAPRCFGGIDRSEEHVGPRLRLGGSPAQMAGIRKIHRPPVDLASFRPSS